MPPRYPRLWLMTDERQGNELWDALHALPRGAGVIVRHYALSPAARKAMFARIRSVARARGLMLILAGPPQLARAWHADGFHGRRPGHAYPELLHTAPAHDLPELRNAARNGAGLVLLSPVHATRSHPGATPLGPLRFGMIARQTQLKVVALGGMNARRARAIRTLNSYGWAGIDGLTPAGRIRI